MTARNMFIDISDDQKDEYNKVVNHPLQSYEWGEFRKKTGVKVVRRGLAANGKIVDGFTLTLHKIPKTKYYIGYLPKGNKPTDEMLSELARIGIEENCVFIQLEPNIKMNQEARSMNQGNDFESIIHDSRFMIREAAHPLFTKFSFILDITKPDDELLKNMHSKTRYNIRIAERHKVKVVENNSEESFNHYLKLMLETTNRQGFYAHTPQYHKDLFDSLSKNQESSTKNNQLSYHLFNALYNPNDERSAKSEQLTLTSWVLFVFHDTLYYPYGASSRQHREVMANNLIAWETIKFGKKLGLKKFDMWGALGPEPDVNDPWYGFHRFKEGYGAELVEFVGSYDLVIRPQAYSIYKVADKARWALLKLRKSLRV